MAVRAVVNFTKLSLIILVSVVLYNEFIAYFNAVARWPKLTTDEEGSEVRILLVADPQIQGYRYEPAGIRGFFHRLDIDRYLSKTFSWALTSYGPLSAVVFMGDLIDEGSIADNDTYEVYTNRFKWIYPSDSAPAMIYLAGDNDVGGEGGERVTPENVARFRGHFPTQTLTKVTGSKVDLVITDYLMTAGPNFVTEDFSRIPAKDRDPDRLRLAFSHLPITPPYGSKFNEDVLGVVKPDIIFSAHFHYGFNTIVNRETGLAAGKDSAGFKQDNEVPININLLEDRSSNVLHEIMVPTCSYRMGVKEMAFGLVIIDQESGQLTYHNLWLPSRFALLYLYAVAGPICLFLFLLGLRYNKSRSRSRRSSANVDTHYQYSKLV